MISYSVFHTCQPLFKPNYIPFRNHGFDFGFDFRLRLKPWAQKHIELSKQLLGQASLSRSHCFEKGPGPESLPCHVDWADKWHDMWLLIGMEYKEVQLLLMLLCVFWTMKSCQSVDNTPSIQTIQNIQSSINRSGTSLYSIPVSIHIHVSCHLSVPDCEFSSHH